MRTPALLPRALLTCCWLLAPVNSIHPECRFHLEIQEEETKCAELLRAESEKYKACSGVWDNLTCWRPADVGETVTVPCPKVFSNFYSKPGNISKNCTSDGWSEMFPDFIDACGYNDPEDEGKITFYILVKAVYTLGYSVSLISLTTGSIILCLFRRLAKSTLLLIPLFGVHYMVFAVFPMGISSKYQILFELCLGSFQGLVVAVLYCFLNSEVQSELRRKWRSLGRSQPSGRDYRLHSSSISRTGSEGALQGPRGSRAASLLQTETSVL
uniref:Vasoactive intestinal peptide receptor 2 n=1 Tax=Equus caballus TaxID=9796 RepID=A0A9L0SPW4_HORSE